MKVIGLDLSLTSTGIAVIEDGVYTDWRNVKTSGKKTDTYLDNVRRLDHVNSEIFHHMSSILDRGEIDLAVLEGPAYGSSLPSAHIRAALWWDVMDNLLDGWCLPVATVAPASRAKYITGNGKADKKTVLAKARERYEIDGGPVIPNDDVADALGMADMGARHLGEPLVPDSELAAKCLESMEVVKWPI